MLTQNAVSRETCHRTMDRAGVCGSKKPNEVLIASESVLLHGILDTEAHASANGLFRGSRHFSIGTEIG